AAGDAAVDIAVEDAAADAAVDIAGEDAAADDAAVDDGSAPGAAPTVDGGSAPGVRGDDRAAPDGGAAPPPRDLEQPTPVDRAVDEARTADWERRAAELAAELDEARGDRVREAALAYELGELYERQLADEARAVQAFGRALKADPSLRANLWAIRRVFYRRQLWPNLLKLIDAEIQYAHDDRERAALAVERGILHEDRLGRGDEAEAAFQQALAYDPNYVPALMALERRAVAGGDRARCLELWRALADASHAPERKLVYLMDIVRFHRSEGPEGVDRARETLFEALALGVDTARLARERARLAELADDPEDLLMALEAQIKPLVDAFGPAGPPEPPQTPQPEGEPPGREAALRLEIAALRRRQARIARERLGDLDRAWRYLERAMEVAPGEPIVVGDLADLAEELGKYEALAALCVRLQALDPSPERRMALELRRAEALARAGKRDDARARLGELAAERPGFLPVVALAERDALQSGDWSAVAAAAAAAADGARLGHTFGDGVEDRAGAAQWYTVAGDLLAHFVGDEEAARHRYAQALEVVPGYPPALDALASLHEAAGRPDEAAALLELHSEADDPALRREVLERVARIYDEAGRFEDALGALERIAAIDPDDDRIRWRMEETLAALGRPVERAAVLAELAARADAPDRRAAIWLEAARVYDEEVDDVDRALAAYREVLAVWPADPYARAAVAELLRRAGRHEELVAALRDEADARPAGAAAARALREAASLLLHRLERPADAADVLRDLLDRAGPDPHVLAALREALERAGDTDGTIEVLERAADDGGVPALLALAEAHEASGRVDDAADAYRRAADAAPEDAVAWLGVWQLAVRRGDAAAEVDALEHLAAARPDPAVAGELHAEAGWLALVALGDPDRAAEAFARAARACPERAGAHLGCAVAEARRGDAAAEADALGRLAAAAPAPVAAAAHLRAAAVHTAAGDAAAAGDAIARAAALAPDDAAPVVAAAEGAAGAAPDDADRDALRRRAERLRRRAAWCQDPQSRAHWNLEAALALERAGLLHDAGQVVAEVLAADPGHVRALQALRRLARRAGAQATLARASLALARAVTDPDTQLELLREAAELFDIDLDDPRAAVPVYRRILALDPLAHEFDRLRDIYEEHGDVGGLYALLNDRLDALDAAEDKVDLWIDRARVRRKLGDARGAARDLDSALAIDPDRADAIRVRGELAIELGDIDGAIALLRRFVDIAPEGPEREQVDLQLSRLLADSMDDPAAAAAELRQVVARQPDDLALRRKLADLLVRAGQIDDAVDEWDAIAKRAPDAAERVAASLRVAELCRGAGRADRARAALARARELDPRNLEVIKRLADLAPDAAARRQILEAAAADARAAISAAPGSPGGYRRLAAVAEWLDDADARWFAVQALAALGVVPEEHRAFAARHAEAVRARWPSGRPVPADVWDRAVRHPGAAGPLAAVWAAIADGVARVVPHEPAQLGFARGDRVGRHVDRDWPRVDAIARAFGVGDYELYVSGERERVARVLGAERPAVFLSADVARADSPVAAFLLGRAFALAREGTGALAELRAEERVAVFAAALRLGGGDADAVARLAPDDDGLRERERALAKGLGRRQRRALEAAVAQADSWGDPQAWARAAAATAARAGLAVAGDVAAALDVVDVGRGGRLLADDPWALDLVAWAASEEHLAVRRALEVTT
ncbi:MAG: tetratricopeptide repeat protein, partial [Deltaproteobacteria bacterium]